jgi:hypothetical protein
MNTFSEFLDAYGTPQNPEPVTEQDIEAATDRLPSQFVAFLAEHGMGSYARRNYWLCHPRQFDDALDALLSNVPDLRGKLAAFGYSATGAVDLWHCGGRHLSLLLPFGVIDDQTSRRQTAAVPYDLAELYRIAGLDMTVDAEDIFRAAREAPEDIWGILFSAASGDGYKHNIGDDRRSLPAALKRLHGQLERGEVYCRMTGQAGFANLAPSYERLPLTEVFRRLPTTVNISRTIAAEPFPETISAEYPTGRMLAR